MNQELDELGITYQLSNCEIMRLEVDDDHYYYGGLPNQTKEYFLSVTQILDIGAPFPEGLRQYLRVTSYEEQKDRLEFTGNRGKGLHEALDFLMQRKELDMKLYPSRYEKDAIVTFIRMMRFLRPGKYQTELIVADPELHTAGTLDFEGFVDKFKVTALLDPIKYLEIDSDGDLQLQERFLHMAEDKRRIHIIIDWKFTGRNMYGHKVQVTAYKTMFNKSYRGRPVSRAFTWRYSPKHKFGFDFSESRLDYNSFKRIYQTTLEHLGEFPEPPMIKRYPQSVRLYEEQLSEGGSWIKK